MRERAPIARIVAGVIGVVVIGLVVVLATRESALSKAASSPLVGKPAPVIDAVTLDGDVFRLDDLRGRWVVVNYFATWCVPCRIEHPELVEFDERHRSIGDARIVSVVFDDDPDGVRKFFAEHGGAWAVVPDDGSIALSFGVSGVPESYLVDPDGFIVAKVTGGVTADGLDLLIAGAEAMRAGSVGG